MSASSSSAESDSSIAAPVATRKRRASKAGLDDPAILRTFTADVEALLDGVVAEAVANITVCGYARLFDSFARIDVGELTSEIEGMDGNADLPFADRFNELCYAKGIDHQVLLTELVHRLQVHYVERALLTGEPDIALAVLRAMLAQLTCGLSPETLEKLATLARGNMDELSAPGCINLAGLCFAGARMSSKLLASFDSPLCLDKCDMRGAQIFGKEHVRLMSRGANWCHAQLFNGIITGDVSGSSFGSANVTAFVHTGKLDIDNADFSNAFISNTTRTRSFRLRMDEDEPWPIHDAKVARMLRRLHPTK